MLTTVIIKELNEKKKNKFRCGLCPNKAECLVHIKHQIKLHLCESCLIKTMDSAVKESNEEDKNAETK